MEGTLDNTLLGLNQTLASNVPLYSTTRTQINRLIPLSVTLLTILITFSILLASVMYVLHGMHYLTKESDPQMSSMFEGKANKMKLAMCPGKNVTWLLCKIFTLLNQYIYKFDTSTVDPNIKDEINRIEEKVEKGDIVKGDRRKKVASNYRGKPKGNLQGYNA